MSQLTKQEVTEIAIENQARAVIYEFLSSLFAKELDESLINQLASVQGREFLSSVALELTLAASINTIVNKLMALNTEQARLELAADFCGLFLIDSKTCASPYAGQYIKDDLSKVDTGENIKKSDRALVFGELHQLMMTYLEKSNIQISSDFPEPADHIAVILAYLAHLSLHASHVNQVNFINVYVLSWLGDFTEQVKLHDPSGFYTAVAELTLQWVTLDIEQ